MIDNFELIKPLLSFNSEDEFYYLQILQRKKENKLLNSNSRVIRNYYINSLEYLDNHKDEIITLCNVFNARASLRLQKRSYRKTAFKAMQNLANTMSNGEFHFCRKSYERALGQTRIGPKYWILDYDNKDGMDFFEVFDKEGFESILTGFQPLEVGNKVITYIPSKNGMHIITSPFNLKQAKGLLQEYEIEVQKDNPTNLYIP